MRRNALALLLGLLALVVSPAAHADWSPPFTTTFNTTGLFGFDPAGNAFIYDTKLGAHSPGAEFQEIPFPDASTGVFKSLVSFDAVGNATVVWTRTVSGQSTTFAARRTPGVAGTFGAVETVGAVGSIRGLASSPSGASLLLAEDSAGALRALHSPMGATTSFDDTPDLVSADFFANRRVEALALDDSGSAATAFEALGSGSTRKVIEATTGSAPAGVWTPRTVYEGALEAIDSAASGSYVIVAYRGADPNLVVRVRKPQQGFGDPLVLSPPAGESFVSERVDERFSVAVNATGAVAVSFATQGTDPMDGCLPPQQLWRVTGTAAGFGQPAKTGPAQRLEVGYGGVLLSPLGRVLQTWTLSKAFAEPSNCAGGPAGVYGAFEGTVTQLFPGSTIGGYSGAWGPGNEAAVWAGQNYYTFVDPNGSVPPGSTPAPTSTPGPDGPEPDGPLTPRNTLKNVKAKANASIATLVVSADFPFPGVLKARAKATLKGKAVTVDADTRKITSAGTDAVVLRATGDALDFLRDHDKLPTDVVLRFTPTEGDSGTTNLESAFRFTDSAIRLCDAPVLRSLETGADLALDLEAQFTRGQECGAAKPVMKDWAACAYDDDVGLARCGKDVAGGYRCTTSLIETDNDPTSLDEESVLGAVKCVRSAKQVGFGLEQFPPRYFGCASPGVVSGATIEAVQQRGTSCKEAETVVRAYTACRLANGPKGRCVKKVLGYACREIRENAGSTFSATVSCARDEKRNVRHSYTQAMA